MIALTLAACLLAAPQEEAAAPAAPAAPEVPEGMAVQMARQLRAAPSADRKVREESYMALLAAAGASEDEITIQRVPTTQAVMQGLRHGIRSSFAGISVRDRDIEAVVASEQDHYRQLGNNVILTVPGKSPNAIVVMASLDAAEGTTGIIDNWVSCLVLVKLYELFKDRENEKTMIFAALAAEELGCLGADEFARRLTRPQKGTLDLVIDLDCLGMRVPSFWRGASSLGPLMLASTIVKRSKLNSEVRDYPSLAASKYNSRPLRSLGVPTLFVEGVNLKKLDVLHTENETRELVTGKVLATTVRLLESVLRQANRVQGRVNEANVRKAMPGVTEPSIKEYQLLAANGQPRAKLLRTIRPKQQTPAGEENPSSKETPKTEPAKQGEQPPASEDGSQDS